MERLFNLIYTGDPLLVNVAMGSHGMERSAAESFVTRQANVRDITRQDFGIAAGDTLLSLRQKLEFLDVLAGTVEHEETIRQIDQVFSETAQPMADQTGIKPEEATDLLLLVSRSKKVEPPEARDFIADAPHIKGFETSADTNLSNGDIRSFLEQGFGVPLLLRARVFGVIKTDEFLVKFSPYTGSAEAAAMDAANAQGLISRRINGFYIAASLGDYRKLEALLEGCDEADVQHTYRNRAIAGDHHTVEPMLIANHSVEDPQSFDYLKDLSGFSVNQLRDLYILGSIAHEVGHAAQSQSSFAAYKALVQSELPAGRPGVSDYAREYIDNVRNPANTGDVFAVEDFAETIRIFTCNAGWLQRHFPARYAFIRKHYPTIVPDYAQQVVL